jgi:hypothetical protein
MAEKLKLTRRELKGLLKRVKDEETLSPEERELIEEILKEAARIGVIQVKK